MPTYTNQPYWNSGSIDTGGLQVQLKNYLDTRSKFNDPSLPAFNILINNVIAQLNNLQNQINTGSLLVNKHTHQNVPPAHNFYVPPGP